MRDLRAIIADDSHAATFQSLGQYRTALLREIDAAAPEGAQPRCPDCNAAVLFECVACSAGNYPKPEGAQAGDEVLIAITRGEGYEDVHPQLVAEDALGKTPFHWRVVTTPPQPEGAQGQDVKDLRDMAKHFAERALLCDPKWNPHQVSARYRDLCLRLAATPPQPQDAARDREDAARYRWLRKDPSMLLHLSNRDFDAAIDAARAAGGGG